MNMLSYLVYNNSILQKYYMKIAFIVGKTADVYKYKTTSKRAPDWLKAVYMSNFEEFINEDNTVPSDVAVAMYMQYRHPSSVIELLNGEDVAEDMTVEELNEFDCIFVIYDAIEIFHCGNKKTCPLLSKQFESKMRKTSAVVYPYPDFHKHIINKPAYYKELKRAGLPVVPFFGITPSAVIKRPALFLDKVIRKGWKGIIIKPTYAGYSLGIKVYRDIARVKTSTIRRQFTYLKKLGFPNVVVQEFVPSFGDNFEIRMYYVNERYAYSAATLTKTVGKGAFNDGLPVDKVSTFRSEGGILPDNIKRKLKPIASAAIRALPKYKGKHPLIRIDFGCCIDDQLCADSYFINEVETAAANLLADEVRFPVIPTVANAFWKFAKSGKRQTGKQSTYKFKGTSACKR